MTDSDLISKQQSCPPKQTNAHCNRSTGNGKLWKEGNYVPYHTLGRFIHFPGNYELPAETHGLWHERAQHEYNPGDLAKNEAIEAV